MLRLSDVGCVVLTEYLAAAEVEIVATDALVRNDLLPSRSREPAEVRRAAGGSAL
jgi:hypothetical protein